MSMYDWVACSPREGYDNVEWAFGASAGQGAECWEDVRGGEGAYMIAVVLPLRMGHGPTVTKYQEGAKGGMGREMMD